MRLISYLTCTQEFPRSLITSLFTLWNKHVLVKKQCVWSKLTALTHLCLHRSVIPLQPPPVMNYHSALSFHLQLVSSSNPPEDVCLCTLHLWHLRPSSHDWYSLYYELLHIPWWRGLHKTVQLYRFKTHFSLLVIFVFYIYTLDCCSH